ncbi:MAG TPA: caspase family protein [Terracidiphilus sp.]|jgi:hypothetical protein|nr:caspase family protein [Terracidiphilus sp.]
MISSCRLRILLIALLAFLICANRAACAQDLSCGAGKDLVVQALERISPGAGNAAFEDALQLLKHAIAECSELGDAWYYRGLLERRLGREPLAKYALEKARFLNSEALQEQLNPLVLATPPARGLSADSEAPAVARVVPDTAKGPVQQKWALVIGISQFADQKIRQLRYTTADATAFADELKDPNIGKFAPANVHLLTDQNATTKNIKEELNWIARHARPNDMVVIYVATHGTPRSADSAGGANYLVTYDTEAYKAGELNEDALYATAYPMVELADTVATRMKALRTAILLDTCYSGGSIRPAATGTAHLADQPPSGDMLSRMTQGTGRIVIAASQANEESLESDPLRHGYFTFFLLEALKSAKGNATLSQIYTSVAKHVADQVGASGAHQHPMISRSSSDADFALGVSSSQPTETEP